MCFICRFVVIEECCVETVRRCVCVDAFVKQKNGNINCLLAKLISINMLYT
jgi:hypothetical protein